MAARIVGVVYSKGGVGKSTTAINLAAAFAARKFPTLLVDFDPQASATKLLGCDPEALEFSVKDVLVALARGTPVPQAILEIRPNLHLLPADPTLVELPRLVSVGAEQLLRRAVEYLDGLGVWQWMLIDSPPSMSTIMANVLIAARELLIPAQAQHAAQVQMRDMFVALEEVGHTTGVRWARVLVVPTMVEPRTVASAATLAHLRQEYRAHVSQAQIRRSSAIVNAQSERKAVQWYDAACPVARDYEALADELIALGTREEVRVS